MKPIIMCSWDNELIYQMPLCDEILYIMAKALAIGHEDHRAGEITMS